MPQLLDKKTKKELKPILDALVKPVKIIFFGQQFQCPTCPQQKKLLENGKKRLK